MKEKNELLLNAALKLFIRQGFYGTPTSQIAKEAGVATGTLFHYFKTKEELINTLYLKCKDSMVEAIRIDFDKAEKPQDKFRGIFTGAIKWGKKNIDEFLFFQQFSSSPLINQFTKDEGLKKISLFFELIEDLKKENRLKPLPAQLIVDLYIGFITTAIYHFIENPEKQSDGNYAETLYQIAWDGMKAS